MYFYARFLKSGNFCTPRMVIPKQGVASPSELAAPLGSTNLGMLELQSFARNSCSHGIAVWCCSGMFARVFTIQTPTNRLGLRYKVVAGWWPCVEIPHIATVVYMQRFPIFWDPSNQKNWVLEMLDIQWSCAGFHLQVFCFPRCWEPCCWTSGKGRARKKNLRVLSIGSSKRTASNQSLLTVSKRKSRCRKRFLLSIFVLQIPGLPLNWPGTPPDSFAVLLPWRLGSRPSTGSETRWGDVISWSNPLHPHWPFTQYHTLML